MVGLLRRDDGRIARQHEVDTWVRHQIGLELSDVNIKRTVEPQRCCERGDDLRQQAVQVGVGGALDVEVPAANIVQRLVVVHNCDVGVLEQRMNAKHRIIRLDDSSRHLGARPNCEADLRLLAIVNREALKHQASQTRASATPYCIVNHEALKASAIVCQFTDAIEDQVNYFFSDRVMSASKVVGRILLTGDQLLRVEQLAIRANK